MKVTIEVFDANGALKTAIATVPAHGHVDSTTGGQLNAGNVFSAGQVPLARGGTNADLSATGGTGQYLKQASAAAAITVGTIPDGDLPTTLAGKTLTTPTIASFTNATHNHSDAAGGGNLGANAFSDQSANRMLAGPTSGAAAEPTFRVLTSADIIAGSMVPNMGIAIFSYEVAAGTNGGTYTASAYATRPLNTTRENSISGASLASNVISLPAGTYRAKFWVNGYGTNQYAYRLRNTTDGATLAVGLSGNNAAMNISATSETFTLAATKDIELQQAGGATRATDGMGTPANLTEVEVYAIVEIERIA